MVGTFQSTRYWDGDRRFIQEMFSFRAEFIDATIKKAGIKRRDYLCMHVRRGDYVKNSNYFDIPPSYYQSILKDYFRGRKVLLFSDDYDYCRQVFPGLDLDYSAEGLSDIESLCLGVSVCTDYVLTNSTFGWWMAYLNNDPGMVVYPSEYFAGMLGVTHSIKDFWPEDWKMYIVKQEDVAKEQERRTAHIGRDKMNLKDVTFIIPVKYDHPDRKENLDIVLAWIQNSFQTNVIVGEQGSNRFFQYVEKIGIQYVYFDDIDHFHRTRMLNLMTLMADTNIIFNHDADVLMSVMAVDEAVELMRRGNPFVYPYNGAFLHVPRNYVPILKADKSIESLYGVSFKGMNDKSVGGCVGFLRDKYIDIGLEDENFHSHAPEDRQRAKFMMLSHGYKRVDYPIYHIDHWCGIDSAHSNDWTVFNHTEWKQVKAVKTREEMAAHIKKWPWVKGYKEKLGL
jgi:hypothetical protein